MSPPSIATGLQIYKGLRVQHACQAMGHLLSLRRSVLTALPHRPVLLEDTRQHQAERWAGVSRRLACSAQESLILPLRTTSDTFSFRVPIFCLDSFRPAAALPRFLEISTIGDRISCCVTDHCPQN